MTSGEGEAQIRSFKTAERKRESTRLFWKPHQQQSISPKVWFLIDKVAFDCKITSTVYKTFQPSGLGRRIFYMQVKDRDETRVQVNNLLLGVGNVPVGLILK